MNIGPVKLPCGCAERKEIIFTDGRPGVPEIAILLTVIGLAVIAWRFAR